MGGEGLLAIAAKNVWVVARAPRGWNETVKLEEEQAARQHGIKLTIAATRGSCGDCIVRL